MKRGVSLHFKIKERSAKGSREFQSFIKVEDGRDGCRILVGRCQARGMKQDTMTSSILRFADIGPRRDAVRVDSD